MTPPKISDLVGLTLDRVVAEHDVVDFHVLGGKTLRMSHRQDCCESVTLEDVCGDLDHLTGSPIVVARESTNRDEPPDHRSGYPHVDSWTWTFYEVATVKGLVTFRWYGESNGFYSESVGLEWVTLH